MYLEYRGAFPGVDAGAELEAHQVHAQRQNLVLVDCRLSEERAVSTLPGAISLQDFLALNEQPRACLYCTIGLRSGIEVAKLRAQGVDAYNLKGSILSWVHEGYPVLDPNGHSVRTVHVYGPKWDLLPDGWTAVFLTQTSWFERVSGLLWSELFTLWRFS
jgi:rhodanese-related sulfurtransferase